MDPTSQAWWQYGAVGGIAILFVSTFLWTFKVLFSRLILHFDELKKFHEVTTETMKSVTRAQEAIEETHRQVSDELRNLTNELRRPRTYNRASTKHD